MVNVAMTLFASAAPVFFKVTNNVAPSPASIKALPFPGASAAVKAAISGFGRPATPRELIASSAMMIPDPELRSTPEVSISMAVFCNALRICAGVKAELADLIKPAIAAACGAAADVP